MSPKPTPPVWVAPSSSSRATSGCPKLPQKKPPYAPPWHSSRPFEIPLLPHPSNPLASNNSLPWIISFLSLWTRYRTPLPHLRGCRKIRTLSPHLSHGPHPSISPGAPRPLSRPQSCTPLHHFRGCPCLTNIRQGTKNNNQQEITKQILWVPLPPTIRFFPLSFHHLHTASLPNTWQTPSSTPTPAR